MRVWLKERRAKQMTRQEAAWLAGFFDGEGSIVRYVRPNKPVVSWRIQIPNTHKPTIDYIRKITGIRNIYEKKQYESNRKRQWAWYAASQRDIVAICEQMLPFLVTKKKAVSKFLKNWKDI